MIYTVGCGEMFIPCSVQFCLDYFQNHESIQVDTESTGLDPHTSQITSLQLGDSENQFFIDCRKVDIRDFKDLLESKLCIIHNAKHDYKMLKSAGIVLNNIYDTMLAECVLYCGYPKWGYSLHRLCDRYLLITLSKEERETFITHKGDFTEKQIRYGILDVTYLEQIKQKQEVLISKKDLEYCVALENNAVKAFGDMEYNGMYLDIRAWRDLIYANEETLAKKLEEIDSCVEKEPLLRKYVVGAQLGIFDSIARKVSLNYASSTQMKRVFKLLGYESTSTDDRTLSKLVGKHPFFKLLQEYRGMAKSVSTYGNNFLDYINTKTLRIHTDFWQIKDTGRVGSSNPNIQNIPADNSYRNCFKARPGFKWVSIDYSQQELRLMADGSGEKGFIDVLNRGEDLHCYVGSMMFKRPVNKEDKALRNKAKTINFGKP